MKRIGIVAFSFGQRLGHEPNPCNVRLAEEVVRLATIEESYWSKTYRLARQLADHLAAQPASGEKE